MRSGNPTLGAHTFEGFSSVTTSDRMTLQGTVNKVTIMLCLLVMSSLYTWNLYFSGSSSVGMLTMVGSFGGLIVAFATVFKKTWAPVTAPIYAILKGFALGGISSYFEAQYPGIVIQAVGLTFATFFCLLGVYKSKIIEPTENFKLGLAAATGGIFLVYLISFVASFFMSSPLPIFGSGLIGIGFSLVVVVIAALNLVMDFDFIEQGCEQGAPKYMEWYGSFGLMVTLIWLYIEILHLLAKLQRRN